MFRFANQNSVFCMSDSPSAFFHMTRSTVAERRYSAAEVKARLDKWNIVGTSVKARDGVYTLDDLGKAHLEFDKALARSGLADFACLICKAIEPTEFQISQDIHKTFKAVEDCLLKPNWRLKCSIPKDYDKSRIAILATAWVLGMNPNAKIIMLASNREVASKNGQTILEIMRSKEYQRLFPGTKISKRARARKNFDTTKGGSFFAGDMHLDLTGVHGDIVLFDNPLETVPWGNIYGALNSSDSSIAILQSYSPAYDFASNVPAGESWTHTP